MKTKRARVEAALEHRPGDRPPYSFWTHFPGVDLDPAQIAKATCELVSQLDMDFVKSMPNGMYCVEDWGVTADYSDIAAGGAARVVTSGVESPRDWERIAELDVESGAYGRELRHLELLVSALGPDVPVLATAFSPLSVAKKLSDGRYRDHIETHPEAVLAALSRIARTMAKFARRSVELGCAGVFLATQEASLRAASEPLYRRYGRPFDIDVLSAAGAGWFNVLHMHGDDVMFDLLRDYPVSALNWHVGETPPSIADYRRSGGAKPIVGGIRRMPITRGDVASVEQDIATTMRETHGAGILLSPGCVIRHPVDRALLGAIAGSIRGLAS